MLLKLISHSVVALRITNTYKNCIEIHLMHEEVKHHALVHWLIIIIKHPISMHACLPRVAQTLYNIMVGTA